MHKTLSTLGIISIAVALSTGLVHDSDAKTRLKLSSTPPGTSPYLYLSAFADVVNRHSPDIEIQVNATGVATKHYVDATRGTVDLFYAFPLQHQWMIKGQGPYKKVKSGPEIAKKASALLALKSSVYQVLVRADSGIMTMMDIKGRKAFLGPPAGGATFIATSIVEGATGYKQGKDFSVLRLGWGAGVDAFRDRQIDVLVNPSPLPAAILQQIAITTKIRFLGIPKSKMNTPRIKKLFGSPGRTIETIQPGVYGKNQVNDEPVVTVGAWGGIGIRSSVSNDVAYKITKAFWSNISEVHKKAVGFKDAIKLENAFTEMASPLHPGAARYYKEIGMTVPGSMPSK